MARPTLAAVVAAFVMLFAPRPGAAHDEDAPSGRPEIIGKVHFPVSCNEAAQREFDRAVALYHSFWFDPANDSYNKVLELDPTCGMADWGLALSALANPLAWPAPAKAMQAGAGFIEKAQRVGARTERERGFIDALAALFANWQGTEHRPRALAWEQSMEKVALANPDDTESQIFYALTLVANALQKACRPPGATRPSRHPHRTHCTCRRTSSPGSGSGKIRSRPTAHRCGRQKRNCNPLR